MKMIATAIVTLFAVAAMANQPATTTTTTTTDKKTTTATAPTKEGAKAAAMEKTCEGKTGKDLETCKAEMKKAGHTH